MRFQNILATKVMIIFQSRQSGIKVGGLFNKILQN